MKNLFTVALTIALLTVGSLRVTQAAPAPRPVSFDVPSSCTCASCAFDTHRVLSKFEGVKKVTLSGKDHRLNIDFVEGKQPLSALALALARLELGKGSTLLWPVPNGVEMDKAVDALSRMAGVVTAKPDARARLVHLSFTGQAAVTVSQLDSALQGLADAHS